MPDLDALARRLAAATATHNAAEAKRLVLEDADDRAAALRGKIADLSNGGIPAPGGRVAWDMADWAFLDAPCPPTAHPALWRMGQLNTLAGLFEVADGVYQARGFDYANMTVIRGATGWILVDPLMTAQTSAAALQVVNDTLGARPVSAILITHPHPDHFAGLRGVATGGVQIYVPEGFLAHAASEGVLGGTHMMRRATYQFGLTLPRGPEGVVDGGIGKSPAKGQRGFVPPTHEIGDAEARDIDGVRFEFQLVRNAEAPVELTFLLPQHRVLCMAEICTQTMHNALPPRGAEVRDTLAWARAIDAGLVAWGDRADVLINAHNWPVWGAATLRRYMEEQRDIYKYTHDQALRLANLGHTPHEIAAALPEPDWLAHTPHARGYYGALKFNARAVYQRYFGWYDGNPVNIDPLPPEDLGQRMVTALGGPEAVMQRAAEALEADDLQWAATLLSHAVFAGHAPARPMLALVHRHQGFRQESGILRNCYLSAASELETGCNRNRWWAGATPILLRR
jgi:alkyl sulfatase BDS1-like metallo-beta-lactamase superfamily hydrolase